MRVEDFIGLLSCPVCRGEFSIAGDLLVCAVCGEDYNVVRNVPILIPKRIEDENMKQLAHQSEWFDRHYSYFQSYRLENWRKSMLKRVFAGLEMGGNPDGSLYLDIGVGGNGYTVIEAARKGYTAAGTDLSIEGVLSSKKFAKAEGVEDKTFFIVCSAEYLPFKDEAFQKISSLSVLEHLYNDCMAAREIARITAPKGRVFITVPNAYKRMWFFLWPFYYYMDKKIGHLRHYSEEDLSRLFGGSSLECAEAYYNGHLLKFYQIVMERFGLIDERKWWSLEERDLLYRDNKMGVQLNAVFKKVVGFKGKGGHAEPESGKKTELCKDA